MIDKKLLKKLAKLGYPLLEVSEREDVNYTLAEVVQSKDLRLWEGFPILLVNAQRADSFDYNVIKNYLTTEEDELNFNFLLSISLALYKALNMKFSWVDKLYDDLKDKEEVEQFLKTIKGNKDIQIKNNIISSYKLKEIFQHYYSKSDSRLNDFVVKKKELGLEYALSQIFSPKQKELFLKKIKNEKLTKTEKEYFSRVVKKKILALANAELYNLSRKLLY